MGARARGSAVCAGRRQQPAGFRRRIRWAGAAGWLARHCPRSQNRDRESIALRRARTGTHSWSAPCRTIARASSAWPEFPARWAERRCRMWARTGRKWPRSSSGCGHSICEAHAFVEFTAAECGFAYRRSRFNSVDRGRYIVTRVDYRLTPGGAPTLRYADLQRAFPEGSDGEPCRGGGCGAPHAPIEGHAAGRGRSGLPQRRKLLQESRGDRGAGAADCSRRAARSRRAFRPGSGRRMRAA